MKIIGLGNALVDILVQIPDEKLLKQLNLPKGSMQLIQQSDIPTIEKVIENLPVTLQSGGSAANTIFGLATLGTRCAYIGKIGTDNMGQFFKSDLINAKVNCLLYESDTPSGRAFTFVTPDGERTFATYLGAAIELLPDDLSTDQFKGYDLLHIEGYLVQNTSLVRNALVLAKENGLMVSLDLASYNVVEANLDFLKEIIPAYIDIVFANEEEAKAYTQEDPEEALKIISKDCNIAVVKIGKQGSLIKTDEKLIRISPIPTKVIDTTGAGDQYAAGFLHALAENYNLTQCGNLGALMAGTVIQNFGARIQTGQWNVIKKDIQKILV